MRVWSLSSGLRKVSFDTIDGAAYAGKWLAATVTRFREMHPKALHLRPQSLLASRSAWDDDSVITRQLLSTLCIEATDYHNNGDSGVSRVIALYTVPALRKIVSSPATQVLSCRTASPERP